MAKIRFLDQVPIGVFQTPTNTTNGSFSGSFTGSLFGTASWAINALTASYLSGSISNAISASYALTASYALNAGTTINTGSFVTTSSFNAFTSSYNTGSFTGSFTGNLLGTSSFSVSSSRAISASYALSSTSASYAITSSFANNAISTSFASTASFLNTLNQDLTFNGNLTLNGTASITYLNVQYESASIIYSSGSNQFGDATNDTQTLIGRTIVSGSFEVTGSTNIPSITGSLLGTASYANQALSSSYALSASYAPVTPPFPYTGSALITGSLGVSGSMVVISPNVDYSSVNTGFYTQFKRDSGDSLRFGTSLVDPNNGVSNQFAYGTTRSIIQSVSSSGVSNILDINPFGGDVKIGNAYSNIILGQPINGANTTSTISAIATRLSLDNRFVLGAKLNFYPAGSDGSGGSSHITGYNNIITFRTQSVSIGSNEYTSDTTADLTSLLAVRKGLSVLGTTEASASLLLSHGRFAGRQKLAFGYVGSARFGIQSYQDSPDVVSNINLNPYGGYVGVGISTVPQASLHVKGNSDAIGNIFTAENLSNTAGLNIYNDGQFYFTAAGAAKWGMRDTFWELIAGSSVTADRYITRGFQFGSNLDATRFDGVQIINGAGTRALNATSGDYRLFSIINNHQSNAQHAFNPSSGTATLTHIQINTDIQQTGTATGRVVAFDYTPTLTSITGPHYGILIRPSTLNGIGLGNTLPTASLHIRGGLTGSVLRLENNTSSSIFTIDNNSSGSFVGFLATTGSLFGTASYATNALSASYFSGSISNAVSASYALTASYATLAVSASYFSGSISNAISASYAATSSIAILALTASYFSGSISNATSASYAATASIATSSSFASTASYFSGSISNAVSASYAATASIATSSSYALTASYVANASSFPFTGSAVITGSLIITGTIALGDPTAPAVYTSIKTTINSGSTVIYNVLTSSYDSAFFDYSLKGSSGARAGNIIAMWSGSSVSYTDNSTADMGNTSGFIFGVILSGSNMVLTGSTSTNGWTLKTAIRTI